MEDARSRLGGHTGCTETSQATATDGSTVETTSGVAWHAHAQNAVWDDAFSSLW